MVCTPCQCVHMQTFYLALSHCGHCGQTVTTCSCNLWQCSASCMQPLQCYAIQTHTLFLTYRGRARTCLQLVLWFHCSLDSMNIRVTTWTGRPLTILNAKPWDTNFTISSFHCHGEWIQNARFMPWCTFAGTYTCTWNQQCYKPCMVWYEVCQVPRYAPSSFITPWTYFPVTPIMGVSKT